ncbi:hypothetical protein R1flu_024102 [Riccia fluitans]|uniref:Piwi domain-containing protein n=1 Tax=Riccia fluitans TaxID=41844 RepID=A0ABD1XTX2_9MARC
MHWPLMSRYAPRVRAQPSRTEITEGLFEVVDGKNGGMVIELLKDFFNTCQAPGMNDRKPQQIVIYRDGVSESQFEQVIEKELITFKNACNALETGYNRKITFIVVQKLHHTRFFPARGGNVKPAAPAYNAHLAAQNCRNFLDADHSGSETSSMQNRVPGRVQRLPALNPLLNKKIFYV